MTLRSLRRRAKRIVTRATGLPPQPLPAASAPPQPPNALVEYQIGEFTLLLPAGNRLPVFVQTNPYYNTNLPRVAKLVLTKYPTLTAIDVGANIGDTVAFLRREASFPILCVEGDEDFFPLLLKNIAQFPQVAAVKAYVGSKSETVHFELRRTATSAQFLQTTQAQESIPVRTLTEILDGYPAFQRSKLLKVDTDGYDGNVLRGASEFLKTARPVLFFEYVPDALVELGDDGLSIFPFLTDLGYKDALVFDNVGDLMLSLQVDDAPRLEELHLYFSGRHYLRYVDFCIFAVEDHDLFQQVRAAEMDFNRRARS